jgi:Protein of unknown function (DUF3300)
MPVQANLIFRRHKVIKASALTKRATTWRANHKDFFKPHFGRLFLAFLLAIGLLFATLPQNVLAQDNQDQDQAAQGQAPNPPDARPAYTPQTTDQLDQLVAPIALYPDSLVAQILAASTFPDQIVEADRWVQANPDLKGDALAQAVDKQPWDPSVKALCAFPTVLGNMDKNISWTSSLGDAYYNQQQDVMDAIQRMRRKAQAAGNLKDTPQQTVQDQGNDVVIQPTQPDVVYVPAYGRLWIPHSAVALLVQLSRDLVWRSVSVLRIWFPNRLVRRLRMGMGSLGIRLAQPLRDL